MKMLNNYAHAAHWLLRLAFISVFTHLSWSGQVRGTSGICRNVWYAIFIMALIAALFETLGGSYFVASQFKNW